ASGKIITGFDMVRAISLGADICASARGMMLALGCIQALRCNNNHCPTGIATSNPALTNGLHVGDKTDRVAAYHEGTIEGFLELLGAMGLDHPDELAPHHVFRRVSDVMVQHYGEIYPYLKENQLLEDDDLPKNYRDDWMHARAEQW